MHHTVLSISFAATFALAGAAAGAQPASTPAGSGSAAAAAASGAAKLARADTSFMKDAAHAGAFEIEGSRMALSKATNPQVKTFAQQMVDDHTKAADALASLAKAKRVELPNEPSLSQKAKLKLLSASDGASFDKRYADSVGVSAHQDAVKLFEKGAANARDADVRAFASKTLPTLQHHLDMARTMRMAAVQKAK